MTAPMSQFEPIARAHLAGSLGTMTDDEPRHEYLWRYRGPREPPERRPAPETPDQFESPEEGRWRGLAACDHDDRCALWLADLDPRLFGEAEGLPLVCPSCSEPAGYPQLLWREENIACGFCGAQASLCIIDPRDSWPKRTDCHNCGMPVDVPRRGSSLWH